MKNFNIVAASIILGPILAAFLYFIFRSLWERKYRMAVGRIFFLGAFCFLVEAKYTAYIDIGWQYWIPGYFLCVLFFWIGYRINTQYVEKENAN